MQVLGSSGNVEEEKQLQDLDVVYCTEDVHYGFTRKKALAGSKKEKLSVHIPVKTLCEAIQEAFRTKEIMQRDLLIVVPIFVTTTGAWHHVSDPQFVGRFFIDFWVGRFGLIYDRFGFLSVSTFGSDGWVWGLTVDWVWDVWFGFGLQGGRGGPSCT